MSITNSTYNPRTKPTKTWYYRKEGYMNFFVELLYFITLFSIVAVVKDIFYLFENSEEYLVVLGMRIFAIFCMTLLSVFMYRRRTNYTRLRVVVSALFIAVQVITPIEWNLGITLIAIFGVLASAVFGGLLHFLSKPIVHAWEQLYFKNLENIGVQFNCNSCLNTVQPIHIFCPSCNQKHNAPLVPNEYGLYYHNCANCDTHLPTQLDRRQNKDIHLYCPHCKSDVPNKISINKGFIFLHMEERNDTNLCFNFARSLAKTHNTSLHTNTDKKVTKDHNSYHAIYQTKTKKFPHRLQFNNITAYDLEAETNPFLRHTDSIVFVIDAQKHTAQRPLKVLRRLLQSLEKYRNQEDIKAIRFNVVFVSEEELQNTDVEFFIENNLNEKAFLHHVKQQFDSVSFYVHNTIEEETLELPTMVKELCKEINVNL